MALPLRVLGRRAATVRHAGAPASRADCSTCSGSLLSCGCGGVWGLASTACMADGRAHAGRSGPADPAVVFHGSVGVANDAVQQGRGLIAARMREGHMRGSWA